MELEDLKKLIEFLGETDVTELEVEKAGIKLKIKREKTLSPLQKTPNVCEKTTSEETQGLITVTSPIVGTFYRSPSPGAPPFVEVGTKVKKGQILCIIEAMKLMNEIESEFEGTIVKIFVEDKQPVEYGKPLFLIGPI